MELSFVYIIIIIIFYIIVIKDSKALCLTLAAFIASWSYTQSVGLVGRWIRPSIGRYLHKGQHKHRTHMPRTEFEHTIPVFERAKRVRFLA